MPEKKPIWVLKAGGEFEKFSTTKLSRFLKRIKVPSHSIQQITERVKAHSQDGVSTHQITEYVKQELVTIPDGERYQARYDLKASIRKLGPEGHVFEQFVGRIFTKQGFETVTGVMMQGKCVQHEIDVLARKPNHQDIVECKFHNREGIRSDVVIAMYTYARFLDIKATYKPKAGFEHHVWLATNTKLTLDALHYADCMDMKVMSVELPEGGSIMDHAVEHNMFPITSLDMLDPYLITLFELDLVMLDDVLTVDPRQASNLQIPPQILATAQAKARRIMGITENSN